ncbi:MAG: ATP synthase F1 subunit epsilon [bacterium]|nr:ATP synthase F1 subunit epsilon [bacterium]
MSLRVELVSPEEVVLEATASMVLVRTTDGDIAFQPGHVPFVGVLLPERVRIYTTDGETRMIAVHSGFVEVSGDKVAILSDAAELAAEIDVDRATAAAERARAALVEEPDDTEAAAALKRAEVRLAVAAGTVI